MHTLIWILGFLAVLAVLAAALLFRAVRRWQRATEGLLAVLNHDHVSHRAVSVYAPADLVSLPPPVQRYLASVLTAGQPLVDAVQITHRGQFNMSEGGARWRPFISRQRVVTRRCGFVWDATIRMLPGLPVRVHDAYVGGVGRLRAALFGVLPLVNMAATPELTQGELMRFLAEAPWYPTVLLPGAGVSWQAVDDVSAQATLRDGDNEVTLLFGFGADGLVASVRAAARGRTVDGAVVPTPWEGRWWDYAERDGMCVPLQGEVAWLLPQGAQPYWRGRVASIRFEFAGQRSGGRAAT